LTFRRVIKKGNVEEFSCVPYILALFNCLLYTWYGLPVVSSGWENMTVSTINGLGILLEITFISIYVWFAPREKKASDLWRIILFHIVYKLLNTVNMLSDGLLCRGLPWDWCFLF
jgi:solute carrier family 50 (sugar transporter)